MAVFKPKHAGGVVVLRGECRNQREIVVAAADSKMLAGKPADRSEPSGCRQRRPRQRRAPPRSRSSASAPSAGGLGFTALLAHLPPDTGMGYVLVQHLDPQHPSAVGFGDAAGTPAHQGSQYRHHRAQARRSRERVARRHRAEVGRRHRRHLVKPAEFEKVQQIVASVAEKRRVAAPVAIRDGEPKRAVGDHDG